MKTNITGMVVFIILLVASLVILPTYFKSIENHTLDVNCVQRAARNFNDAVIDNRVITEDMVANLNLSLAECHDSYSYKIYRHQKVVTPNVNGNYDVDWVLVEVNVGDMLAQGDFIQVSITQESVSIYQAISSFFLPASYEPYSHAPTAMVR